MPALIPQIPLPSPDIRPAIPARDALPPVEYPMGAMAEIYVSFLNVNSPPVARIVHGSFRTRDDGTAEYSNFRHVQIMNDLYAEVASPLVMPAGYTETPPTPDEAAVALQTMIRWFVCRGIQYRYGL